MKWLPYERRLVSLLREGSNDENLDISKSLINLKLNDEDELPRHLNFKISYDVPFFTWILAKFGGMHAFL